MKKFWLLPVFALALYGGDLTGKWTGSIDVSDPSSGGTVNTPVKAEFAQHSGAITGKIGRTEEEQAEPIRNAKLDGKNLVFEVRSPEASGLVKFNLVLVGEDRIEGDMKGVIDVGNISGKVHLKKVK